MDLSSRTALALLFGATLLPLLLGWALSRWLARAASAGIVALILFLAIAWRFDAKLGLLAAVCAFGLAWLGATPGFLPGNAGEALDSARRTGRRWWDHLS